MFSLLTGVPLLAVMALGISQATTPHTEGEESEDSQICAFKFRFNTSPVDSKKCNEKPLALFGKCVSCSEVCQVVPGQRRVVSK